MNVIGHQETNCNSNASANADAMLVEEQFEEEEVIASHTNEGDCFTKLFGCIAGSHSSITEAFTSQVMTPSSHSACRPCNCWS